MLLKDKTGHDNFHMKPISSSLCSSVPRESWGVDLFWSFAFINLRQFHIDDSSSENYTNDLILIYSLICLSKDSVLFQRILSVLHSLPCRRLQEKASLKMSILIIHQKEKKHFRTLWPSKNISLLFIFFFKISMSGIIKIRFNSGEI